MKQLARLLAFALSALLTIHAHGMENEVNKKKLPLPQSLRDLHKAAADGDIQTIVELIGCGAYINTFDHTASTPLHYAIFFQQDAVVDYLLKHPRIDVNTANMLGLTPLHVAAGRGSEHIIRALLDAGALTTATNAKRETPFDIAQQSNRPNDILTLLRKTTDSAQHAESPKRSTSKPYTENRPNRKHNFENDAELVDEATKKIELESEYQDITQLSALDNAIEKRDEQQVFSLLADPTTAVNKKTGAAELTPLHRSVLKNSSLITQRLLDAGADIYARNRNGQTPIDYAKKYNRIGSLNLLLDWQKKHTLQEKVQDKPRPTSPRADAIALLLSAAAFDEQHQESRGNNLEDEAFRCPTRSVPRAAHNARSSQPAIIVATTTGSLDQVKACLADPNTDVNEQTRYGGTALHRAVQMGRTSVVQFLLEHGADLYLPNHKGKTPLDYLKEYSNPDLMPLLSNWQQLHPNRKRMIENNDDENITKKVPSDNCERSFAVNYLTNAQFEQLLDNPQTNVNAQNSHGTTLLHLAVRQGLTSIVQRLLDRGANPNVPNKRGKTPIDYAKKYSRKHIIELLEEQQLHPTNNSIQRPVAIHSPLMPTRVPEATSLHMPASLNHLAASS